MNVLVLFWSRFLESCHLAGILQRPVIRLLLQIVMKLGYWFEVFTKEPLTIVVDTRSCDDPARVTSSPLAIEVLLPPFVSNSLKVHTEVNYNSSCVGIWREKSIFLVTPGPRYFVKLSPYERDDVVYPVQYYVTFNYTDEKEILNEVDEMTQDIDKLNAEDFLFEDGTLSSLLLC